MPQKLETLLIWNLRIYFIWVHSFLIGFEFCELHVILETLHFLIQTPPTNSNIQCSLVLPLYSFNNPSLRISCKPLLQEIRKLKNLSCCNNTHIYYISTTCHFFYTYISKPEIHVLQFTANFIFKTPKSFFLLVKIRSPRHQNPKPNLKPHFGHQQSQEQEKRKHSINLLS